MADDTDRQLELLRPTLEWVVAEVRKGKSADVPRSIRPVLRFKKLSLPALKQVHRAIESDDQFRERMVKKLTPTSTEEIGRLWLERDPGWQDRFDLRVASETRRLTSVEAAESEDDAERRARDAELASVQALDGLAAAELRLAEAEATLAAEQDEHRSARSRIDELDARLEDVEAQRAEAVRQLKKAEALAQRRLDENRELAESFRTSASTRADSAPQVVEPTVDTTAVRARLEELAAAITAASGALTGADDALSQARELLTVPDAVEKETAAPIYADPERRRVAARLPGGLRDDGPEAAKHLVRVIGAVMLVDGYNQSMYRWSDSPISVQRALMTQRLGSLAARTGVAVDLVFDGDDPMPSSGRGQRSAGIRVRFSPADVEADDVIIELCDVYPPDRTVIVASDDRRVRSGALAAGANVIGGAQLHALLAGS